MENPLLLVIMYKMKTWKQEFLVMVYISITAFRYTHTMHGGLSMDAQTVQVECNRQVA